MDRSLTPAQRVIVAADYKPEAHGRLGVRRKVISLARSLKGTGVTIKVNSALRALGYGLIDEIHALDLGVFADLKLGDIEATLEIDGKLLAEAEPELLTVLCSAASVNAMKKLKTTLPDTEVLGVTLLTDHTEDDARVKHGCTVEQAVLSFGLQGESANLDGLVASAAEATMLLKHLKRPMSINTANIRPAFITVTADDQNKNRSMTPFDAIMANVTRLVIGRPITQASNPYDAAMKVIDEVTQALEAKARQT